MEDIYYLVILEKKGRHENEFVDKKSWNQLYSLRKPSVTVQSYERLDSLEERLDRY